MYILREFDTSLSTSFFLVEKLGFFSRNFREFRRAINLEPLWLGGCHLICELLRWSSNDAPNLIHFRSKLTELLPCHFRFSAILVTSLWVAGVSDQLPVLNFWYVEVYLSTYGGVLLVFAYIRSGDVTKVGNFFFGSLACHTFWTPIARGLPFELGVTLRTLLPPRKFEPLRVKTHWDIEVSVTAKAACWAPLRQACGILVLWMILGGKFLLSASGAQLRP